MEPNPNPEPDPNPNINWRLREMMIQFNGGTRPADERALQVRVRDRVVSINPKKS